MGISVVSQTKPFGSSGTPTPQDASSSFSSPLAGDRRRGGVLDSCGFDGVPPVPGAADEYRSTVYYHCNAPLLGEQICIRMPNSLLHVLDEAVLEISFWHVFSNESSCECFSFGFLRLADENGVALQDTSHDVLCYDPVPEPPLRDLGSKTLSRSESLTSDGYPIVSRYVMSLLPTTVKEKETIARQPNGKNLQGQLPEARLRDDTSEARVPIKLKDRDTAHTAISGDRRSSLRTARASMRPDAVWRFSERESDRFVVRTFLQSTIKTNVRELQTLRHWRSVSPAYLMEAVRSLPSMPPSSIAKILRLVFTPLLDIMGVVPEPKSPQDTQSKSKSKEATGGDRNAFSSPISSLLRSTVFRSLVETMHSAMSDPLAAGLTKESLDEYVSHFMCAPSAGHTLLLCILQCLRGSLASPLAEGSIGPEQTSASSDNAQLPASGAYSMPFASKCLQVLPSLLRFAVGSSLQNQMVETRRAAKAMEQSIIGDSQLHSKDANTLNLQQCTRSAEAIVECCLKIISAKRPLHFTTLRVVLFRNLPAILLSLRPLLNDDKIRRACEAALCASPIRICTVSAQQE